MDREDLVSFTADIVSAHVANNNVPVADLPNLIRNVHAALSALAFPPEPEPEKKIPAVSVRGSIKADYLVCLECGARKKMLKRHLSRAHDLSPQQYRADYGLPADYPMIASNHAERRRAVALAIGLGQKSRGRRKGGAGARRTGTRLRSGGA